MFVFPDPKVPKIPVLMGFTEVLLHPTYSGPHVTPFITIRGGAHFAGSQADDYKHSLLESLMK